MYRPDIDGLRAISALAIFAFHLGITGFPGGFVGVDIFFVISGFLIIPRILDALESKSFSLSDFFERRARRIMPGLLLVLLFCFAVGYFVLSPREFEELGLSAIATLAFGANFFFYDRSDYFADVSHQKPLLHAWSLGVEEQFYILIPLFLMGCRILFKFSLRQVVVFITATSLAYNLVLVQVNESHAFYLPISRFWELGIGGLVALYTRDWKFTAGVINLLWLLGVFLLITAISFINKDIRYPGVAALIPVLGATLIILTGQFGNNPISHFLGTDPLRYIGRISYSLYLIHWPIIVFTRLYLSRPLELKEQAILFVFGIMWSMTSWHFVENTILMRQKLAFKPFFVGLAISVSVCFVVAAVVTQTGGLPGRMSDKSIALFESIKEEKRRSKDHYKETFTLGDEKFQKFPICQYGPKNGKKILFWGDSHSDMMFNAFYTLYGVSNFHVSSAGMPDCPPLISIVTTRRKNRHICPKFVELVIDYIINNETDVVVLGSRWANLASDYRAPGDGGRSHTIFDTADGTRVIELGFALSRTIDHINNAGADVIVMGPVPEIPFHVPDTLIRAWSGIGNLPEVTRASFEKRQAKVLEALREIEDAKKAFIIYPHQFLCDASTCDVTREEMALYTDDDHLSVTGARTIINELVTHF